MATSLIKIPGTYEELTINCPRCDSSHITVAVDSKGYFTVIECAECGYKKPRE